jgi:hypothetical protein
LPRGAAVSPSRDRGDLFVAQRRIDYELLDADVLLDEERRLAPAGCAARLRAFIERARGRTSS